MPGGEAPSPQVQPVFKLKSIPHKFHPPPPIPLCGSVAGRVCSISNCFRPAFQPGIIRAFWRDASARPWKTPKAAHTPPQGRQTRGVNQWQICRRITPPSPATSPSRGFPKQPKGSSILATRLDHAGHVRPRCPSPIPVTGDQRHQTGILGLNPGTNLKQPHAWAGCWLLRGRGSPAGWGAAWAGGI